MNTRSKLAVVLSLTASLTAFADVKVNENFTINGYAVGSWTGTKPDGGATTETRLDSGSNNLDSVKLGLLGTSGQLSGYGSVLYIPGAANEAGLLDAYVTVDTGMGVKITGGKFLSYLGYEAFDPINMAQLSYGSTIFAIPGYHTGGKIDFAGSTFSAGVAVVDSVFHGAKGFFEGDREFSDDVGIEAMVSFTGIKNLTVFAGIATEDTDGATSDLFIFDLWASYALTDKITIAGEIDTMKDTGDGWLAFASYKFSDKFSTAFRVSGVKLDPTGTLPGRKDQKYTIAPSFTINSNLALRGEISLNQGDSGDSEFYGVQAILKW